MNLDFTKLSQLGHSFGGNQNKFQILDLWQNGKDLGEFTGSFKVTGLEGTSADLFKLVPVSEVKMQL